MSFQELRKKFIEKIARNTETKEEWKQPNIDDTYYYRNRQLPHIYLTDMCKEETTTYLGENKYFFKTSELSIEENYKLVRNLINRMVDSLGSITYGAVSEIDSGDTVYTEEEKNYYISKRKEYEKFCKEINTKLNISNASTNQKKAFQILEDFLPKVIDFYNSIMMEEKEMLEQEQK